VRDTTGKGDGGLELGLRDVVWIFDAGHSVKGDVPEDGGHYAVVR
jgi:hypothetical protein